MQRNFLKPIGVNTPPKDLRTVSIGPRGQTRKQESHGSQGKKGSYSISRTLQKETSPWRDEFGRTFWSSIRSKYRARERAPGYTTLCTPVASGYTICPSTSAASESIIYLFASESIICSSTPAPHPYVCGTHPPTLQLRRPASGSSSSHSCRPTPTNHSSSYSARAGIFSDCPEFLSRSSRVPPSTIV